MINHLILSGDVIQKGISLNGGINTKQGVTLSGDVKTGRIILVGSVKCSTVDKDAPRYEGPYEATPKSYEQTLLTDDHYMEDNVVVNRIPYSEVSNPQGGKTVNIGEY